MLARLEAGVRIAVVFLTGMLFTRLKRPVALRGGLLLLCSTFCPALALAKPAGDVATGQPLLGSPYTLTLIALLALVAGGALSWGLAMRRSAQRHRRELDDQRHNLQTLVNTLPDVVFVKDLKGVYLACNPAFQRVLDRPEAEILGHSDHELAAPAQADNFRRTDLDTLAADRALMYEEPLSLAPGDSRGIFQTIKTPMRNASGRVVGVLGISRDVTEQRKVEQRLRRLNQLYHALTQVQDAAHRQVSTAELYATVCQAVVHEGGMTLAWIGSPDAHGETLRPVHRAGDTLRPLPPLSLRSPADRSQRSSGSTVAALRAWREERTVRVADETPPAPDTESPLEGANAAPAQRAAADRAWLAMPLTVNGERRAVLCLLSERADRFDTEEIGLLERLALQVGLALAAAELDSARQQIVSALRDSEKRFALMFQTSPVGMLLKGLNSQVVDVNQAWLDLFGYRRDDVLGRELTPAELGLDPRTHQALLQETLDQGRISGREIRLKRRHGEWLDIAYSATRTELNGQDHLLTSFVDITLQKHATRRAQAEAGELEGEVARRKAELDSIFDALPDRYYRLSRQGVVLDFRAGTMARLHRPPAEFLGRALTELLSPEISGLLMAAIERALAVQGLVTIEYDRLRPDGQVQTDEARFVPIGTEGDVVAVMRDISERRALESAREGARDEAERQARHRSEFLANMSHEIRTPLNGILGFAQLGYEQTQGQPAQAGYGRILEAGQLLLAIVNDVLDFSKIEAGRMDVESIPASPRQLVDAAADLVREAARQKGLSLKVQHAPELPLTCMTDPTRLQQILVNLLANAVKFTHRGSIEVSASRDGEWLQISVQDSGIGMNAAQMEQLFAPFRQADASTTRRYGGTGLGLTISRQLAELMGGRLLVRSAVSQGSTFTLRLPLRAVPPRWQALALPLAPPPAEAGPPLAGLRLLVAEDNPVNQIVIQQALSQAGASVVLASNGREAVEQVVGQAAAFDAVLMDIQMPDMDGYEATRRIRLLAPQLPVIGQTAHALQEERDQCLACGMVAHISKPIDLQRLVATLRAVVQSPAG